LNPFARVAVFLKLARCLLLGTLCIHAALAHAATDSAGAAAALRHTYDEMVQPRGETSLHRPFKLVSSETTDTVSGEAFGLIEHPFVGLRAELADPGHWCDILILHVNNKACHLSTTDGAATISMMIARKYDQPVEQAYPVEFLYRIVEASPQYMAIQLSAASGPLGTSDYRIVLEAIPIGDGRAFLHFSYSYRSGFTTRLAMGLYFATVGSGKVGFTEIGRLRDGQPEYIGGSRGLVERNTMRYFLAIEAYLSLLGAPPSEQFERRLGQWFDATELHKRQLHEVDRQTYLDIKRREHAAASSAQN
jgi:hypothetical protein